MNFEIGNIFRSQKIRNRIPYNVKNIFSENKMLIYGVKNHSNVDNIYHCCVHKTASQWIRRILNDKCVYQYSGLRPYHYQSRLPGGGDHRSINDRKFLSMFPTKRIISPLYINHENFMLIPQNFKYKCFFITRDPRDIVISWYFSTKFSHPIGKNTKIYKRRELLNKTTQEEGLLFSIKELYSEGLFKALFSWIDESGNNRNEKIFKFEDLTGCDSTEFFIDLFKHCKIDLTEYKTEKLLRKYRFRNMAGREKGNEDKYSKYRKGITGDWKNYFNSSIEKLFYRYTDDLVEKLGYDI